ncbi:AAA family ATPase [Treponema primitia]|uniref:AAA family ATPase n=1 Tax=Treponema primitia TaxID=88058 RepID=UPI00025555EB|nr:AAA family ATPase [Treponema primitia]
MRPLILSMENFGPFVGRTRIDFTVLDEIFLITGQTGSGKTTIFDAICFALYGTVPGSRQGHIDRLRSDYAEETQECLVSLEFSIGEKRYRVDRSPKQEKLKKRGIGVTTVEETATLWEILPGDGSMNQSESSRKSETDQRIRDLIGLSAQEFFKIVLLPQGEFAEFLRQNTTQRREVLSKLFPVDFAVRVRLLAQEKAKEAAVLARGAEHALEEIVRRVSFDTYPELHRQAEEAVKKARGESQRLEQESVRLGSLLTLEENRVGLEQRLEQVGKERAVLEAETLLIEEKESRLALSRKAQPLAHHLVLETEKRETLSAVLSELEKVRGELTLAERKHRDAETTATELPALEKELAGNREKRPALLEMAGEEKSLDRNREEMGKIDAALKEGHRKIAALKGGLEEKDRVIAERKALADQGTAINDSFDRERELKDRLMRLRQTAVEAEELGKEAAAAAARNKGLEARKTELEQRIPVLREELAEKEAAKETGERADMAVHLAAELKPGAPCPVCGSTGHPNPAAARVPVFGIRERIESLRGSLKDAERDLTARSTELESGNQELTQIQRKLDRMRESMSPLAEGFDAAADSVLREIFVAIHSSDKPLPLAAELGQLVEAKSRGLTTLAARQKEARLAGDSAAALYREREGFLTQQMNIEKEVSGLGEKYRILEKTTAEMEEKHRGLLREWNLSSAAEALIVLDRTNENLEKRIREIRETREAAGRELAAAKAREEGITANRTEAERQRREAADALKEALAASAFPDAAALEAAILDRDTETVMEASVERWKTERSRLKTQGEELERSLEENRAARAPLGTAPGEPVELRAVLEALVADRAAAEAGRDRAAADLASLERDETRLREAKDRHEALSQRAAQLQALSDDLSGKNPKKKAFDAWLLGLYLKEVAALATKRLERMSEFRYSLILNSEGESGRGLAGLDLAVFDSLTGKTRPCATLSGGESFMASISLALGLADSIQTRSGGVRLDAVFIDEGFGSLDDASLDKALIILDELREHRMVGLISHVGEMRSRIPSRIDVIKTGSGSTIRLRGFKRGERSLAVDDSLEGPLDKHYFFRVD